MGGPLTVQRYGERWIAKRRALAIPNAVAEESGLRVHIYPVLGDMRLDEVRPRHVVKLVHDLRQAHKASRTIRNIYSILRGLFRDAALEEAVVASPCILRKTEIGEIRDKVPGWRKGAVFSREEAEALISDARVPLDRRVLYAILLLGGVRHGEAAGLRWEHLDLAAKPLGRITVETSYDKGRTKTGVERLMPIHPTLASILAEWKLAGWESVMGRKPESADLLVPTPPPGKGKGRRTPQAA